MFVRWKRRPTHPRYPGQSVHPGLAAVLVESVRVDGKPSQRLVAYLGHIAQKHLPSVYARGHFWTAVDQRLAQLDLEAATRNRILQSIARAVPRPSPTEFAVEDARYRTLMDRLTSRRV